MTRRKKEPSEPTREDATTKVHHKPGSRPRPASDRCTLMMLTGPSPGAMLPIEQGELVLGRGHGAGAQIEDAGLSRLHARVFAEDGVWYVEDLGSKNGTFVGNEAVEGKRALRDGDRLHIGRDTLLKVALQDLAEQRSMRFLYESAMRDPLTRLRNRRYLDERLDGELAYSLRHGTRLSVMMIDIDDLDGVNDSQGHKAGDEVLKAVASTVERIVRSEDVVVRYDGDGIAVLAREVDPIAAAALAERILKQLSRVAIPWEGRHLGVTVTIGVANHGPERVREKPEQLMAAAREALDEGKRAGGKRVQQER